MALYPHLLYISLHVVVLLIHSSLSVTIEGKLSIADIMDGLPALPLVLSGSQSSYTSYVTDSGNFNFYDVQPGRYQLQVQSSSHLFSQYKIDISGASSGHKIRVLEYKYPSAPKQVIAHPIMIDAHSRINYFQKRESFGLHTLLANPTMLMMLFTGAMALLLPRMMANMDPEELKEVQAQMNQQGNPQEMLSNMFGGGGKKSDDEEDDD